MEKKPSSRHGKVPPGPFRGDKLPAATAIASKGGRIFRPPFLLGMRLVGILMFALCAVRAVAACPPLTEANVFIAVSGFLQIGDPFTLRVRSFGYDLECGPHEYRWTFSDAYLATGREVTRVLTARDPLEVAVEVR